MGKAQLERLTSQGDSGCLPWVLWASRVAIKPPSCLFQRMGIRKKLFHDYFMKRREHLRPVSLSHSYEWNQPTLKQTPRKRKNERQRMENTKALINGV